MAIRDKTAVLLYLDSVWKFGIVFSLPDWPKNASKLMAKEEQTRAKAATTRRANFIF